MRRKQLTIIYIIILSFFLAACKKATPTLPPPVDLFHDASLRWQVAYYDNVSHQLCAMNDVNGSILCSGIDENPTFSSWSPDGSRLAFIKGPLSSIYIWEVGRGVSAFRESGPNYLEPKWSPDGSYLAYMSDENQRHVGKSYATDIFVTSLDGTIHRNVTSQIYANNASPAWSPDGQRIAFSASLIVTNQDQNSPEPQVYAKEDIYVVSPDGSNPVNLTNLPGRELNPVWSPDGQLIAFINDQDGPFNLYLMNSNGSDARIVTNFSLSETDSIHYTWLPDGIHILFNDQLINLMTDVITQLQFPFDSSSAVWHLNSVTQSTVSTTTPRCAIGWSRLAPGKYALVLAAPPDPPARVRSGPGKGYVVIAQYYADTIFKILEGPVCAEGLVYWKVEIASNPTGSGWAVEGDFTDYFLSPYVP